jgi:hypothetical protein
MLWYTGIDRPHLGRPADAATASGQTVEPAEQTAYVVLHAGSPTWLGASEQELGDLDTALELQHRALAALPDQPAVGLELEIRHRPADCHRAAGRHAAAQKQFELARAHTTV